jgi:hypothetical protein
MTRLEKNKAKRNYKTSIILSIVFILLIFVNTGIAGILSALFTIKSMTSLIIVVCIIVMPLLLSFGALLKGQEYLSTIKEYKKELLQKRNDILEKMAIETMKGDLNKDTFNKVINIHNAITYNNYKAFIKGYIIATYKNSPDLKLKEFVEEKLRKLIEY